MALLSINKSLETLMATAIEKLKSTPLPNGKFISIRPGSIARLLLAIINSEQAEFYKTLEKVHLMSFLSTAKEEYVDLLGELVQCKRNEGEDDKSYKHRISIQITVLETSNELAVRMAVLSVPGVQDAIINKFTHGAGSFSVFLITETGVVSENVINDCIKKIDETAAYGIKYTVSAPELVPVELGVKLIFLNGTKNTDTLKKEARKVIREYINSKTLKEPLVINEIIQRVMGISKDIYDLNIFKFRINNNPALTVNQDCRWNERFIESSTPNAIVVS